MSNSELSEHVKNPHTSEGDKVIECPFEHKWLRTNKEIFIIARKIILEGNYIYRDDIEPEASTILKALKPEFIKDFPMNWPWEAINNRMKGKRSRYEILKAKENMTDDLARELRRIDLAIDLACEYRNIEPEFTDLAHAVANFSEVSIPRDETLKAYFFADVAYQLAYTFSIHWLFKNMEDIHRQKMPNRANGARARKRAKRATRSS
jgi:hypothetical protein